MSQNVLRLIPTDPNLVPQQDRQRAGLALLKTFLPHASSVEAKVNARVQFIDCGANLEAVSCPRCSVTLTHAWWLEATNTAYESDFQTLDVLLPCCAERCSLNDLAYDWPMGFARFVLEAKDPGIPGLEAIQHQDLEAAVGCELRTIWALY